MLINCLVQVNSDNTKDFAEWIEYHRALGFNTIFVFDNGSREWLPSVVERYKGVVLVPNDDWSWKSTILRTYASRRKATEWAICLSDDEYLWIDPKSFNDIRSFVEKVSQFVDAVSIYTSYMSSEAGMVDRVGTKIDCFIHARPFPLVDTLRNPLTPNTAVTMLKINPGEMPMNGPTTPVSQRWIDAGGRPMSASAFERTVNDPNFNPVAFPVRCYKYALRSGVEMEFKPGTRPVGYTVLDMTMQDARERLLGVSANKMTETLFAKSQIVVNEPEKPSKPKEMTPEELEEMDLPIKPGKIDKFILGGCYLEDIEAYLDENSLAYNKQALSRVFDREREEIGKVDVYRKYKRLMDNGVSDEHIRKIVSVSADAAARMVKCLKVLDLPDMPLEPGDIPAELESIYVKPNEPAVVEVQTEPEPLPQQDSIVDLVNGFDSVETSNSFKQDVIDMNKAKFAEIDAAKSKPAKRSHHKKKSAKPTKPSKQSKTVDSTLSQPEISDNDLGMSALDDVDFDSLLKK